MATAVRNTHEGAVMETARYMSPEQVQGRVVDTRSDIFSFGCMLTLSPPFTILKAAGHQMSRGFPSAP
jgi:eukaryotic-like serine/threonine-protein kinase